MIEYLPDMSRGLTHAPVCLQHFFSIPNNSESPQNISTDTRNGQRDETPSPAIHAGNGAEEGQGCPRLMEHKVSQLHHTGCQQKQQR